MKSRAIVDWLILKERLERPVVSERDPWIQNGTCTETFS